MTTTHSQEHIEKKREIETERKIVRVKLKEKKDPHWNSFANDGGGMIEKVFRREKKKTQARIFAALIIRTQWIVAMNGRLSFPCTHLHKSENAESHLN